MSAKTSTPPQAYTRETLTKAFEWMKSQPEAVKDKVTSADALVRFYLHSKRFGSPTLALLDDRQPNLEDLISVENFKQDLKDLAQGLRQFEDDNAQVNTSASVPDTPPSTKGTESGRLQQQTPSAGFYSQRLAPQQDSGPLTPAVESPAQTLSNKEPAKQAAQPGATMNYSTPPGQAPQYSAPTEHQPAPQYQPSTQQHYAQPQHPQAHGSQQAPAFTVGWDEKTYMAIKSTKERFNLSSDQEALRMLVATGFDRLRESFLKGY